jgi:putative polyhydroxyalkanoate system protein
MADIHIEKEHCLDIKTARKRLRTVAADLEERLGIQSAWEGDTCILSGTGIKSGMVRLTKTAVSLELTLGLFGKAVKPKIEAQINSRFEELFL